MFRAITPLPVARSFASVTCAQRRSAFSAAVTGRPQSNFVPPFTDVYFRCSSGSITAVDKEEYKKFMESLSPARKKFLDALYEYHASNFEHTTPNRFFKMIVKAVDANQDGVITMEEYKALLKNIGAHEKMTEQDAHEIFDELGDKVVGDERVITVESIEQRWTPFLHVMWKK